MEGAAYLAVDWGTTNRRTYVMDDGGRVLATQRDDHGVKSVAQGGYPAELAALRHQFGHLPAIAAGMVGSSLGWQDAGYVGAPAELTTLAGALTRIEGADFAIVPGVSLAEGHRADVMRGEEVQVLGANLAGLAPRTAIYCQPGTHTKWITVEDGRLTDFTTMMTGEIFALLRDHSILAEMMRGAVADGPLFREGLLRATSAQSILSELFGVRAAVLLGRLSRDDAAAMLSGLLIGSDVVARQIADETIYILADPALGSLYAAAVETLGGHATLIDSHAAFVAGIHHIWELQR